MEQGISNFLCKKNRLHSWTKKYVICWRYANDSFCHIERSEISQNYSI